MNNKSTLSISAFFPAYNDAGTIGRMVEDAVRTLKAVSDDFEVIVVNDGSHDGTGAILEALRQKYACVRVIHHEKNTGYGGALISGFSNATKDLVFYTDGDGQYDVGELKLLLENFGPNVDIVNGYKIARSDPWYRILIGRCYQVLMRIVFGLKIRDVDCDFRLFRRAVFDRIELRCKSGVICVELMKKLQETGCRIKEVPVHHYPRRYGQSQFFRLRHLTNVALQLFVLWWRLVILRKFVKEPNPGIYANLR